MTRSRRSSQNAAKKVSRAPSVRVVPEYDDTDALDAYRILQSGNLFLDDWQFDVLSDWMALNLGRWVCRTCGGSVPRQNGKTGLVQGRAESGMIMYNEQIIYTAHLQKTSTGKGSRNELRDVRRLVATYKRDAEGWEKRVGKVYSDKYVFDVHWYEHSGIMYEHKIKNIKEK